MKLPLATNDTQGQRKKIIAGEQLDLLTTGLYPKPGDVVILDGEYCGCERGDQGTIEGIVGVAQDEYLVCFHVAPAPFRGSPGFVSRLETSMTSGIMPAADQEIVSCSGGPALYIKAADLKPCPYMHHQIFWKWKDLPRAGGGEDYRLQVPSWIWEGRS